MEQEEDYQKQCDLDAQAEYEQQMSEMAKHEVDMENEAQADQAMEEQCRLYDLRETIIKLEGVKIPFNIIKQHIQPLKEWLDSILPKRDKSITTKG